MDGELLGAAHRRVVELLVERLQQVQTEPAALPHADSDGARAAVGAAMSGSARVARVVLLEGESGVGKSRIVRELYGWLQTAQIDPPYWPPLQPADGAGAGARVDPLPGRKVLGPPVEGFEWPAGALPDYLWWAISCDRLQSGQAVDVLRLFEQAMRAHLIPLSLARAERETAWTRLTRTMREHAEAELREFAREGAIEAAGKALELTLVQVPGLGWMVNQSVQAWSWARTRARHYELARAGAQLATVEQSRSTPAEDMLDALRQVLRPGLPAVVVIEDLHLMGDELGELIDQLAASALPIVVVATAWPEGRSNPDYATWLATAQRRGWVEVVPVRRLDDADLVTLVRQAVPAVDEDAARRLAARWPNQLALLLVLSLEKFQRRAARTGTLHITDAELDTFPDTLRGIYRARWAELPADVQRALLLAAAGLGRDDRTGDPANAFIPATVVHAATTSGLAPTAPPAQPPARDRETDSHGDPLIAGLDSAMQPHGWLIPVDPITQFRDPILIDTALFDLDEVYGPDEISMYRRAIAGLLAVDINVARGEGYLLDHDDTRVMAMSAWLHGLSPTAAAVAGDLSNDERLAHAVAAVGLARGEAEAHRWLRALTLADNSDWHVMYPPDHPDTLTTRHHLASWRGQLGQVEQALTESAALLADQIRVLGPDHADTLVTRHNLAYWRADLGQVERAFTEFEALLAHQQRVLGPSHPHTLTTRHNLAYRRADLGQVERALIEFAALLADQIRVLGPDHPDTLITRSNLAQWRGQLGQVEQALIEFEALLADRIRVLGPDHPDTLGTRNDLAGTRLGLGRVEQALIEFEALLADRIRVLGPDHPHTLTTRNDLAGCRAQLGQVEHAVTDYEALLADRTRVLGPDHPYALNTRNNLAHCRAETGQVEHAVTDYEALLTDRTRVLGPDHPHTLTTRNNLAHCWVQLGQVEQALTEFEALLADQQRILGPDHPETLTTRNNLAHCWVQLGQVEQALTDLEALLADRSRVLGADHPDTLGTRNNLAGCRVWLGQVEQALTEFEVLLADQQRMLGCDHPATLLTRHNLAHLRAELGQTERALRDYEALYTDAYRVLDPNHPLCGAVRSWLEQLRGNAGS